MTTQTTRLRLMAVLAHPDDESLGFGGTLAKYAAAGVETFLVTATRGESGRYRGQRNGEGSHPGPAALAKIREAELHAAASVLGIRDVCFLDYYDGQLDRVNARQAIQRIVRQLRRVRPDVVITFGAEGAYGHPDHIAISQFTSAAVVAAADPAFTDSDADERLAPHSVAKLYYLAWPQSTWAAYEAAFKKLTSIVEGVERQAVPWPDWALTTAVDARDHSTTVWRAVSCHESQVAGYERLKDLIPEHQAAIWGCQSFYRVLSLVNGGRQRETDLFDGIVKTSVPYVGPSFSSGVTPASSGVTPASSGLASAADQPGRQAPLAMDAPTFRAIGHRLVDQVAEFLDSVPRRPVTHDESPSEVREALDLDGALPERGVDPGPLLERTAALLFDHSLFNSHPRFFGYITAPPAPIGILGDFLASAVNPNVGAWILSPAASEVESQTIRWIAELIGYPSGCGGLLVSGGNMANFVCFLAARAAQSDWDVRERGLVGGASRVLRVYASAETHTWIQKAADLAGIGTVSIRWIPTDRDLRMSVAELRGQIDADLTGGDLPFMVVGTAGSVSTGVVDPLHEIADVCRQHRLWFHVDGAYGGFAAASPEAPAVLRALSEADSVAVDPHKWLYAPLEAGCALVRDPEKLRHAFAYHPPYYQFEERATNYVDYGPQNSRGFLALKVWLALRHVGAAGYRQMISDDIRLSRAMAERIRARADMEVVTQDLSITTFRYLPPDLRAMSGDSTIGAYLETLNRELLDRLQRGGEAFVSNAVISGRYVLRACIVNFHTTMKDVEELPEIVARVGREIDAQRRPAEVGSG